MTAVEQVRDLYRHMEWADAEMWRAVLACPAACADAAMLERLHHIHLVQRAFLFVWRGQPTRLPELATFPDAAAVARWGREYHAEVAPVVAAVDEERLRQPAVLPWAEEIAGHLGTIHQITIGETMMQVPMHSQHHRAQVSLHLRQLGSEPPALIDYIVWLWRGRPAAGWGFEQVGPAF